MKYESRRYNKSETGKEFYARRKQEMEDHFNNPCYKTYEAKMWAEYREKNHKKIV
jgi:hypothetical protein